MEWTWNEAQALSYLPTQRTKITASAIQKAGKTFIEIEAFWNINDVFIVLKKSAQQFYIVKWEGYVGRNKRFSVKRVDGNNIIQADLDALVKGNILVKSGFVQEPKGCITCS